MGHLLGLRRRPGTIVLAVFRIPQPLYRLGAGWIFGHAFLLLVHRGRKTGSIHETALKTLTFDRRTREVIVFSAWGESSDWVKNIRVHPAEEVRMGRETFTPVQRFLSEEEAFGVVIAYRRRHPWRLRLLAWLLGWPDLRPDAAVREFVRTRPFVSLRPAEGTAGDAGAASGAKEVEHDVRTADGR
jgi:deazaflavin-dependent oxidoreductase (nitroreductase family)